MKYRELFKHSNVVGAGIGLRRVGGIVTDRRAVVVLVSRKLPRSAFLARPHDLIPATYEGIYTDVLEIGYPRAYGYKDRVRPLEPGYSIGHYKITAGTLGAMVFDPADNKWKILSNNHVLANSNEAVIGDPIYQPGPADGGRDEHKVARLDKFITIDFGEDQEPTCPIAKGTAKVANVAASVIQAEHRLVATRPSAEAEPNVVDAALAVPIAGIEFKNEIPEIGIVTGTTDPYLGMGVEKTGRTTGYKTGSVLVIEATIEVAYGSKKARYENQIITTPMSAGGDSGSLVVEQSTKKAVGLLFAGSPQVTIDNPIKEVAQRLGFLFVV